MSALLAQVEGVLTAHHIELPHTQHVALMAALERVLTTRSAPIGKLIADAFSTQGITPPAALLPDLIDLASAQCQCQTRRCGPHRCWPSRVAWGAVIVLLVILWVGLGNIWKPWDALDARLSHALQEVQAEHASLRDAGTEAVRQEMQRWVDVRKEGDEVLTALHLAHGTDSQRIRVWQHQIAALSQAVAELHRRIAANEAAR